MGTRCLTVVKDQNNEEDIIVLYRQYDGYLDGHGKELKDFLEDMEIVNGLRGGEGKTANGMGCLAAQLVTHFKDEAGGFYLYPSGTRNCGEDYLYTVYFDETLKVKVESFGLTLFDGPVLMFDIELVQAEFEIMQEKM